MCRFQYNQQCKPQMVTSPPHLAKVPLLLLDQQHHQQQRQQQQQQQQFARNNNVTFFSPDSSDDSEDDDNCLDAATTTTTPNHANFNFWQSCHDNFFRSFRDNATADADTDDISCHDDDNTLASSLSLPSLDDDDTDSGVNSSSDQNGDSSSGEEEDSKTAAQQASSIDGSSFKPKSILAKSAKRSLPSEEKRACERRVSFADRWGMQLASYRAIPSRYLLLIDELKLDFNEVNFPGDASDYWRASLYQQQQGRAEQKAWSFEEEEELGQSLAC